MTTYYVALYLNTANPTSSVECNSPGYARQPVTMGGPTGGTGVTAVNATGALFLPLTAATTIRGAALWTAATGGTLVSWANFGAPISCTPGGGFIVQPGDFLVMTSEPGTVATPGIVPNAGAITPLPLEVGLRPEASLRAVPYNAPPVTEIQRRSLLNVSVAMPTPAIVNGVPTLPKHWGRYPATMSLHTGAPSHAHAISDPDPQYDPATGGWYVQPPAVTGDLTWSASSLPNPAGYDYGSGQQPSNAYPIGASTTADLDQPTQTVHWTPDGAPGGPGWTSHTGFRPWVINYNSGETNAPTRQGVIFQSLYMSNLWADMGSGGIAVPYTWMIAGILTNTSSNKWAYLLDSGTDPATAGYSYPTGGPPTSTAISSEAPGYHTQLVDMPFQTYVSGDDFGDGATGSTGGGSTHYTSSTALNLGHISNDTNQPTIWFGVWNGTSSTIGRYTPGNKLVAHGTTTVHTNPHLMMIGRHQGYVGEFEALDAVIFQIKFSPSAYNQQQLDEAADAMSNAQNFPGFGIPRSY